MTDELSSCCKIKKQCSTYNAVLSYTPYLAYSQTIRRRRTIRRNYFTQAYGVIIKLRRKYLCVRPAFDASEQHVNFPFNIVSAKLTVVTYTQAFWPNRTLVDPLLVNVRHQLLQTFHVLAVISNPWPNVTDSLHNFTRKQHRQAEQTTHDFLHVFVPQICISEAVLESMCMITDFRNCRIIKRRKIRIIN